MTKKLQPYVKTQRLLKAFEEKRKKLMVFWPKFVQIFDVSKSKFLEQFPNYFLKMKIVSFKKNHKENDHTMSFLNPKSNLKKSFSLVCYFLGWAFFAVVRRLCTKKSFGLFLYQTIFPIG